jgi:hypothetical protein
MVAWFVENGVVESVFKIMNRVDEEKIEEYETCKKILRIMEVLL